MSNNPGSDVISMDTQLDIANQALANIAQNHPPYGFVNLDDHSTAEDLLSTRIGVSDYIEALSFCGKISDGEGTNFLSGHLTIGELQARFGKTHLGGLGALMLAKAVTLESMRLRGVDEPGKLKYRSTRGVKVMQCGFDSGFMAMGMLAQRGFEAIYATHQTVIYDQIEEMLINSINLPFTFANLRNDDNWRVEVLYGVRVRGAFNAESAQYELGLPKDLDYSFVANNGRVEAGEFSEVRDRTDNSQKCGAMSHPVFKNAWRKIVSNTVALNRDVQNE